MISKHLGDILPPDSVIEINRGFSNIQGSLGEMGQHAVLNNIFKKKGKLIIHLGTILTF